MQTHRFPLIALFVAAFGLLCAGPVSAEAPRPSFRSLHKGAVARAIPRRTLARALFRLRHVPGAVEAVRQSLQSAQTDKTARADLAAYLKVRGGEASQVFGGVLGGAVASKTATTHEPIARFIVGGQYRSSRVAQTLVDPTTGKPIIAFHQSSKKDVLDAISAADGAAKLTAKLSPAQRSKILTQVAKKLTARRGELGRLLALEAGKPLAAALGEVDRAVNTFTLAAAEALKLVPSIEQVGTSTLRVDRTPIGTITAITPFNFPLNLVAHKLAPAMAAGNPMIIKPSPRTPLTALALAQIVSETAWPKGALSVVIPDNKHITPLIKDPRIKMISFTGSEKIGWQIKAQAPDKRVALELGGNAALIVHRDAKLIDAVQKAVTGAFAYQGQVCISTQRILVHEKHYDSFVKRFVAQTKALRAGDPLHAGTQQGPMIDAQAAQRLHGWVQEAVAGGAKVLAGGKLRGSWLEPTVIVGAKPTDKIMSEEAFGPVVVIQSYKQLDSALKTVNASRFGLQAGIFSKSQRVIDKAYRMLQVGGLVVNNVPTVRVDQQPYGGIKRSGWGREGPRYAIEEMTELKSMLVTR